MRARAVLLRHVLASGSRSGARGRGSSNQVSRSAGSIESRAPQRFVAEARCRTAARGYLTRIAMLPRPAQRAWQDVERVRHCARTKSGRGKEDRARYSYVIGSPSREHGETEQPLSPPRDEPTRSSSRDAAVRLHSPTRRRLERPQCIQTSQACGETPPLGCVCVLFWCFRRVPVLTWAKANGKERE